MLDQNSEKNPPTELSGMQILFQTLRRVGEAAPLFRPALPTGLIRDLACRCGHLPLHASSLCASSINAPLICPCFKYICLCYIAYVYAINAINIIYI